jgi:multidrug efflux pump
VRRLRADRVHQRAHGQFFRQFALTIAFSTLISAFNSLTLSPALAAILLKPHGAPPDRLTRAMDRVFGRGFRAFNRFFERSSAGYGARSRGSRSGRARRWSFMRGWSRWAIGGFAKVPTGFVPTQDKQYLIAFAQLPDAATLDRTESVIARMAKAGLAHPAVADAIEFPGLSINGFVNSPNSGIIFFGLTSFEERTKGEDYGPAVAAALTQRLGSIQDAYIAVFPPPR